MSTNQLTIKDVCALVDRKRWTVYRYMRSLDFPSPLNPNTYPRKWDETAVREWAKNNGVAVFRGSEE